MAEHAHSEEHHSGGPSFYLLIAAILAVITFVEFALIQWPQAWLSTAAVLVILIVLSIVKFLMVIAYFMHLRDDENTYSGFFASGMVIALGTFVVLTFLFTVPSVVNSLRGTSDVVDDGHEAETATLEEGGHGAAGIPAEVLASIESEGYSRGTAEILDSPRPKDQTLLIAPPPVAAEPGYTLTPAPPFGDTGPRSVAEPTTPGGDPPAGDPNPIDAVQTTIEFDRALGMEIYNRNCVGCHQGSGRGIPGAFPPLAVHLPTVYGVEGGRTYLIDVVLYGLQGQLDIQGQSYTGVMPAWAQFDDDAIAAVLNHILTDWGNEALIEDFVPITADEVAAERATSLTSSAVLERRNALDLP